MRSVRDRKTGEIELQPDEYVPHGPVRVKQKSEFKKSPPKRKEARISGHIYSSDSAGMYFGPASDEIRSKHKPGEDFFIRHVKVRIEP